MALVVRPDAAARRADAADARGGAVSRRDARVDGRRGRSIRHAAAAPALRRRHPRSRRGAAHAVVTHGTRALPAGRCSRAPADSPSQPSRRAAGERTPAHRSREGQLRSARSRLHPERGASAPTRRERVTDRTIPVRRWQGAVAGLVSLSGIALAGVGVDLVMRRAGRIRQTPIRRWNSPAAPAPTLGSCARVRIPPSNACAHPWVMRPGAYPGLREVCSNSASGRAELHAATKS